MCVREGGRKEKETSTRKMNVGEKTDKREEKVDRGGQGTDSINNEARVKQIHNCYTIVAAFISMSFCICVCLPRLT